MSRHEVSFANEATARTLERVVDAGAGLPSRGEGVPVGGGRHTDRETIFRHNFPPAIERDGVWVYRYAEETKHLALRPLLNSEVELERDAIVLKVDEDDPTHTKSRYLSGLFRRVLSDFDPKLFQELDFLGIALDRSGDGARSWQRTDDADIESWQLAKLLDELECPILDGAPAHRIAIHILRHVDRRLWGETVWFAAPFVLEGPSEVSLYAVGIPEYLIDSKQGIVGRPEVLSLFRNALEAALYVCASNVSRYVERPFLTAHEVEGLAPPLLVAQVMVAALVSNDGGLAPTEQLVSVFEDVAQRPYEGRSLEGQLVLGPEPALSITVKLAEGIDFSDPKLVRKVLEAQAQELVPVGTATQIIGFGNPGAKDCTRITFAARGWRLGQVGEDHDLIAVTRGIVRPMRINGDKALSDNLRKLFSGISGEAVERLARVVGQARHQKHGTMVVIATDLPSEVERLTSSIALRIEPCELNKGAVQALSRLDGAFLFDTNGYCHAAGVIVDGPSIDEKGRDSLVARSRGARYNSARRYLKLCEREKRAALVIVMSEDGYFDMLPPKSD